jgi:hypothetical protein
VYASGSEYATSLAPAGGVVKTANGQPALVYGVVVNHYAPFEGERVRREANKRGKLETPASTWCGRSGARTTPPPVKGSTKQRRSPVRARSVTLSVVLRSRARTSASWCPHAA